MTNHRFLLSTSRLAVAALLLSQSAGMALALPSGKIPEWLLRWQAGRDPLFPTSAGQLLTNPNQPAVKGHGDPFKYDVPSRTVSLPLVAPGHNWRLPGRPVRDRIKLPPDGALPAMRTVQVGPRDHYVEFAEPLVHAPKGTWTQSLDLPAGLVSRVLVAVNRPGVMRIAVRSRAPVTLQTHLELQKGVWRLAVRAVPVAPPSMPPAVVPSPSVEAPVASPSAPQMPLPTPSPMSTQPPAPVVIEREDWSSDLSVAQRFVQLRENYRAGNANQIYLPNGQVTDLLWSHRFDTDHGLRLGASFWRPYTIQDIDLASSLHTRQPYELVAKVERSLMTGPVRHDLGGGLFARYLTVQNATTSLAPSYVFSTFQAYTGPEISDTMQLAISPWLSLTGSVFGRVHFVFLDPDVPPVYPLAGYGGSLGLEVRVSRLVTRASIGLETVRTFSGLFDQEYAPMVSLSAGYRY